MHPRGVVYNGSNQGLLYNDNTTINASFSVSPNTTYTYMWLVPESVAPTSNDWPCVSLLYTSGVDLVKDVYTGKECSSYVLVLISWESCLKDMKIFGTFYLGIAERGGERVREREREREQG